MVRITAGLIALLIVLSLAPDILIAPGVSVLTNPVAPLPTRSEESGMTGPALALRVFAVTVLNPKSPILFFAVLPQFLDHACSVADQALALVPVFGTVACITILPYAVKGSSISIWLQKPGWREALRWIGGGFLIAAALVMAATHAA